MMIYLKELNKKKVTNAYVSWMNDLEVHQYTEQKYKKHTINDVLKFVEEKKKSKIEFLYGIFLKKTMNISEILNWDQLIQYTNVLI